MPLTATGPLGELTFISSEEVDPNGTGAKFLRLRFSLDRSAATEALTKFEVWHDNGSGDLSVVWANATNLGTADGGDGGTPIIYEALIPKPLATTGGITWEAFEEYPLGLISPSEMDKGGVKWDGAWGGEDIPAGHEGFESYALGVVSDLTTLNGGSGWNGAWSGESLS